MKEELKKAITLANDSFNQGKTQMREEIATFLLVLSAHVTEEDSSDLPKFLRVLAQRINDGEVP